MNVKLIIAYDGTDLLGWQKTPYGRTVEEELLLVLERISQEPIKLQAASRTDAGVHAKGQVVNFHIKREIPDLQKFLYSVNQLLPKDIVVVDGSFVPENFHSTLDSKGKIYHYHLDWGKIQFPQDRRYSWHYPHLLNIEAMKEAALKITGEHDFSAFCNVKKNESYAHCIRNLKSIVLKEYGDKSLKIEFLGNHFLYKMVRNIVGTLVYVGSGKIKPESISSILLSQDRSQAGITAPAHGLCLYQVLYEIRAQSGV
jgi:tRNA pseudouridine38-40 synthase